MVGSKFERRRWFYQRFARVHRAVLVRLKGRSIRQSRHGYTFLVLETVGARSGEIRQVPLLYLQQRQGFVVLASNYGQERPPGWFFNLRARPEAHVLTGGERIPVRSRVLDGDERTALVPIVRGYNAQWNDYFDTVQREIPMVLLTPVEPNGQ
jgi:deazaflavin-dependent oxidoreductase (nitroreductase family)